MTEPEAAHDPTMLAAMRAVGLTAAALALITLVAFGAEKGLSVAAGGAIATVNLIVFARVGQAFVARNGMSAPWFVIGILKLVLLLGGVWLLIKSGYVSGVWLAGGYGALPLGITLGSLFGPRPPDDADTTPSSSQRKDVIQGGASSSPSKDED